MVSLLVKLKNSAKPMGSVSANLTMQMHMRSFTRLTNAFSKKSENHCNMVVPYAIWYNFIRIYKTLRVTPARESSIVDHPFSFEDLVESWPNGKPAGSVGTVLIRP